MIVGLVACKSSVCVAKSQIKAEEKTVVSLCR